MAEQAESASAPGVPYKFECHRSHLHRYVPADGVWVGVNGHGKYILNFFNDSPPLPKTILAETTADGNAFTSKPPEVIPETDAGAVRLYEISVALPLPAVKLLATTLQNFVNLAEGQAKQSK